MKTGRKQNKYFVWLLVLFAYRVREENDQLIELKNLESSEKYGFLMKKMFNEIFIGKQMIYAALLYQQLSNGLFQFSDNFIVQ